MSFSSIFVIFLASAVFTVNPNLIGWQQSIAVSGRLICEGSPAQGVLLKLYDENLLIDTLLAESYTNRNGEFAMDGHRREISDVDPKLNIYHRCNYYGPCSRKIAIRIPHSYLSDGKTPSRVYDVGTINLGNRFNGDTIDCIH
ncbi:unnamed protein product [Caenorhabditis auriculariae]|uniref:Uncharacterized protein n=1 Tax=Caenorhabditis auriculariae TaxID=2777116 RepID=A0A8S1HV29_9PELO|nr:unnamed protein product [Caenorhabditis auriculariae]